MTYGTILEWGGDHVEVRSVDFGDEELSSLDPVFEGCDSIIRYLRDPDNFLAGGDEDQKAQTQITTLEQIKAFLEGNTHYPDKDSSCDGCVVLAMLERR